jgi:hypothetical protein
MLATDQEDSRHEVEIKMGASPHIGRIKTKKLGKKWSAKPYRRRRPRPKSYAYLCNGKYTNSLDMIRRGLKMDSILLLVMFIIG